MQKKIAANALTARGYIVEKPLQAGLFSRTLLVKNSEGEKYFAKCCWAGWDSQIETSKEIEILKSIDDCRVPKVEDSFWVTGEEEGASFYLLQKYIEAPNLKLQALTLAQVYQVTEQMLEILVFLQSRTHPVIHRDIKPENILYDGRRTYLVDFGGARQGLGTLHAQSILVGTPGYWPPEALSAEPPDHSYDLYSLGVTMLSLISGGTFLPEQENQRSGSTIESRTLLPGVSHDYIAFLQHLASPKRSSRPTNAHVALQEFRSLTNKASARRTTQATEVPQINRSMVERTRGLCRAILRGHRWLRYGLLMYLNVWAIIEFSPLLILGLGSTVVLMDHRYQTRAELALKMLRREFGPVNKEDVYKRIYASGKFSSELPSYKWVIRRYGSLDRMWIILSETE